MAKKSFFVLALLAFMYGTTLFAATGEGFIEGEDIRYTKPVRSVLFTHQVHVNQKKISCDQCHGGLFDMEALKAELKKDFNMESLNQGKYCGACHNGNKAFASDTQCARCHLRVKESDQKGASARPRAIPSYKTSVSLGEGDAAVLFNHETHTVSSRCTACHPGLFKIKKGANRVTMADHGKPKYCFACHDGKKSFSGNDCSRCHAKIPASQAQAPGPLTYAMEGAEPVQFLHKKHGSFACNECHPKSFAMKKGGSKMTMAVMYQRKSCGLCHNGKKAFQVTQCAKCHQNK
jgi:c(7)-type cytochrome triheme protein